MEAGILHLSYPLRGGTCVYFVKAASGGWLAPPNASTQRAGPCGKRFLILMSPASQARLNGIARLAQEREWTLMIESVPSRPLARGLFKL